MRRNKLYFCFFLTSLNINIYSAEFLETEIDETQLKGSDHEILSSTSTLKNDLDTTSNIEEQTKSSTVPHFWKPHTQQPNHNTSNGSLGYQNVDPMSFPLNVNNKKIPKDHIPPSHYQIKARLLSNKKTGHSYFCEEVEASVLRLPFRDCSSAGITTPPIPLQNAVFRQLPPFGTTPSYHPAPTTQLVICLEPLEITTFSGQSKKFSSGDVVLLDDVYGDGHSIIAMTETEENGSVIILTLKDQLKDQTNQPCPTYLTVSHTPSVRRLILSAIGLSLSSALTYFLGKVAPHVLAVGVGGACVLVGGTTGVIFAGEKLLDQIQSNIILYHQQQSSPIESDSVKSNSNSSEF